MVPALHSLPAGVPISPGAPALLLQLLLLIQLQLLLIPSLSSMPMAVRLPLHAPSPSIRCQHLQSLLPMGVSARDQVPLWLPAVEELIRGAMALLIPTSLSLQLPL